MKIKQEHVNKIQAQLALEYNCNAEDFSSQNNVITLHKNHPDRRLYTEKEFFFQMVTFGNNAVISSDKSMHEWLKNFVKCKTGHWLFEHGNLVEIENKLNGYGKKLSQTHHMFLPIRKEEAKNPDIKTKWFEQEDIHQFYETKMFPNAFCKEFDPKRPDMLAVAAYNGGQITGMAGCSADTPELWQIGIDVNENFRGKGIGTYLVTLLKNETEKRGKIPFYGTSLSNLASWGIALNSGFYPAWIEISTIED